MTDSIQQQWLKTPILGESTPTEDPPTWPPPAEPDHPYREVDNPTKAYDYDLPEDPDKGKDTDKK